MIATSVPIGDEKAVKFSSAFYRAMANKRSIKLAYEFAKGAIETEYRDSPEFNIQRGIGLEGDPSEKQIQMPWTLFVKKGHEDEILGWQLPYYREVGYFRQTPEPYADLGEIVTGALPGRESSEERTLSLNLGLAIEDVATARLLYGKALEKGVGLDLPL